MAKRRGNNEGQIMRHGKKWRVIVTVGKLPNGKPKRKTAVVGSHAAALVAAAEIKKEAAGGKYADSSRMTVGGFLARWLEDDVRLNRAENTYLQYRSMVRNHIVPYLGQMQITQLAPINVQAWIAELAVATGATSRRQAFATLNSAMGKAVVLRLVADNPCAGITRPTVEKGEIWPFTPEEVGRILGEGHRLHGFLVTGFLTGMRLGELLGLQWKCIKDDSIHVDWQVLESGKIVRPKRGKTRVIDLPDKVAAVFTERKTDAMREGNAASPFVWCTLRKGPSHKHQGGAAYRRSNFYSNFWIPLLEDAEVAHRGFHHVRHTYATEQLRAGVDPQEVAATLGHTMQVLLTTYSHVVSRDRRRAADVADRMYG